MRLLISFAALFLSVVLLQLGSGGIAPLDAISGLSLGFSRGEIGLLGSAHFVGFFIGCWWAPRVMGQVGLSRAFAAFTAAGTIGIMAHMMLVHPLAWAGMRVLSGFCIAGCYTIIESWLQAKVTNETRGRTMAVYRVVDVGGSLAAQLVIGVLEPASYVAYNLLAIVCCAALLPLTLTRVTQPAMPQAPRLRPSLAWSRSPLAALGVIVAGLTTASFRMVGPVYGVEVGLTTDQIAWFLAAFVLGGALCQYPAGWAADRYDRRWVLIWLSAGAIVATTGTTLLAGDGSVARTVILASGVIGFATFPIYSVSAAHAHDFASADERVELSAALVFLYAIGAIAAPYLSSLLIEWFGPSAMLYFMSAAHIVLIVFGLLRMRVRPAAAEDRTRYIYAPRTSFQVGQLLSRFRDRDH